MNLSKLSTRRGLTLFVMTALVALLSTGCWDSTPAVENDNTPSDNNIIGGGGIADDLLDRDFEVLLTEPFCDVCNDDDRAYLRANSPIVARVIELIDDAEKTIDVGQFTFSDQNIEAALVRAHERGVDVRIAIDAGQDRDGSVTRRLADAGLNVRFVRGAQVGNQDRYGLMHSKFMIVDHEILLTGSNNWSSTGTSTNEENTIIMSSVSQDGLIHAFRCHFEAAWAQAPEDSSQCSTADARFSPGIDGRNLVRDGINEAHRSIDVLMHHLLFDSLVRDLADAAERGVQVRVVLNAEDRETYEGGHWDRLVEAGGQLRFKQNNPDIFQYMHHKLAIVDGQTLYHGSGNWSGSGFFNNYEFYVRYRQHEVVEPFIGLFERLWDWSLSPTSLDTGLSAARQHFADYNIYFGNLHAHIEKQGDDGKFWDDGELLRREGYAGDLYSVADELAGEHPARHAFEYARDRGRMDYMAISPHVVDFREDDAPTHPNLTVEGFADIVSISRQVTAESEGTFVAIPAAEWNTNSEGNHVNIFGTDTLVKVERGRFDTLFDEWLPQRVRDGERPLIQFNHPRTFRQNEESLSGSWDQIYGVNLQEIPNDSERARKFNDFGLQNYPPLKDVIDDWIAGDAMPDPQVVSETQRNIQKAAGPYLRLMEVTIGRGTDIAHEEGENPSWVERDGQPMRYTRVETDWHYYLLEGFRLAPTANHDNHYANWGSGHSSRTAIMARQLTERDLMEGIDRRLVYATEDEQMALGLYANNRIPMGSEMGTTAAQVHLNLFFDAPDLNGPFDVKVYRGRIGDDQVQTISNINGMNDNWWHSLTVPLPSSGEYFVYVTVEDREERRKTWSAPIWVTRY